MNRNIFKRISSVLMISFFLVVMLAMPVMAAGEFTATRTISDAEVSAGDTVRITLVFTANQYIEAPVLEEGLPSGWLVTDVSSGDDVYYKNTSTEWIWAASMNAGENKTVVYDLTIPDDADDDTYSLSGVASTYDVDDIGITGDSQIEVDDDGGGGSSTTVDAAFTANDTSGQAPLSVKFTDHSTGSVSSWKWDFDGDGDVDSTDQNPVYTYTANGKYTVKLTVSDGSDSDSLTKTGYITVSDENNDNPGYYEATAVSLSATIIPEVSIEVTPGAMDFGTLSAGEESSEHTLHIRNKGATDTKVTVQVTDVAKGLYEDGLWLNSGTWDGYSKVIEAETTESVQTSLHVPDDFIAIGSMEGKLVFWAEAS